jgi:hypothetical protein
LEKRLKTIENRFEAELKADNESEKERKQMLKVIDDPAKLSRFLKEVESKMIKVKNPRFQRIEK